MLSLCVRCKEAGGGGEGARDTESKTRTPHKVVGNNIFNLGVYVQTNPNISPNILSCVVVSCHPGPREVLISRIRDAELGRTGPPGEHRQLVVSCFDVTGLV